MLTKFSEIYILFSYFHRAVLFNFSSDFDEFNGQRTFVLSAVQTRNNLIILGRWNEEQKAKSPWNM